MTYRSRYDSTFPSSCDALIWHSTALLLPAKHMAPLTLYPPSDLVWELLPHALRDICMQAGRFRWHFLLHSLTDHFFLFFARFSVIISCSPSFHCPLRSPLSCCDNPHRGQGGSLADRQFWCMFGLFCCSRDIYSNT